MIAWKGNARGGDLLGERSMGGSSREREKIDGDLAARPRLRPGRHPSTVTPSIDRYDLRFLRRASNGAKSGRFGSAPVCLTGSSAKAAANGGVAPVVRQSRSATSRRP